MRRTFPASLPSFMSFVSLMSLSCVLLLAAGPTKAQAEACVVDGATDSPTVTMELATPRGAKAMHVYAAARVGSGSPPRPSKYDIDCSTDGGKTWKAVLAGWQVLQRPPEPKDWFSQTFTSGDAAIDGAVGPVRVRFANSAKRPYMRTEAHLVYEVANSSPLKVTFAWKEAGETKTATHTYPASTPGAAAATWTFQAAKKPQTAWVEYAAE